MEASELVRQGFEKIIMGGTAGVIAKTATSPLERIKLLSQTGHLKTGTINLMMDVFRKEGIFGFWRGNLINCIRVFPNKGILFSTNDMYNSFLHSFLEIEKSSTACGFLSGALAGMTAVIMTYPLDVIRTRRAGILGGNNPKYASLMGTARMILEKAGPRGFFQGLSVTITGAIPYEGLKFGIYPIMKATISPPNAENDHKWKLLSGSLTGIIATTFVYHFDTVRRVRQLSGASGVEEYLGTLDAYKRLIQEGGVRRLYKGIIVNTARIIPNTALQFWTYETLKEMSRDRRNSSQYD